MSLICGVDEAGRGPLAGPVVAAAVVFNGAPPPGLADSKKLSSRQRQSLSSALRAGGHLIGVGVASPAEIDELNILQATFLAMRRAVAQLELSPAVQVIVDGNILPELELTEGVHASCLVKADSLVAEVSAASIIAKQTRDSIMLELDEAFPGYGFAKHQGYGVPEHLAALNKLGPTPIHRKSFAPVRNIILASKNKQR